jgi:hypothetical protein
MFLLIFVAKPQPFYPTKTQRNSKVWSLVRQEEVFLLVQVIVICIKDHQSLVFKGYLNTTGA